MTIGIAHQAVHIHKWQQPGIQLDRFGLALFTGMTDVNFKCVI